MASRLHALSSSFGAPPRAVPQRFAASFEAAPLPEPPPPAVHRPSPGAALDWDLPPGASAEPLAAAASIHARLDRTVSLSAAPEMPLPELLDRHHEDGQRPDLPAENKTPAPALDGVVLPPQRREPAPEARAASLDEEAFERAFAALMSEAQQGAVPQPAPPPTSAATPAAPPDDDPHEIFNRMGRSMQYANTFNLGRIDIDRHFDALERSLALGQAPQREPAVFALSDEELADDINMTSSPAAAVPDRAAFVQSPASAGPDSRNIAVAPAETVTVQPQPVLQAEVLQTPEVSAPSVSAPDPNPTHEMEPVAPV